MASVTNTIAYCTAFRTVYLNRHMAEKMPDVAGKLVENGNLPQTG